MDQTQDMNLEEVSSPLPPDHFLLQRRRDNSLSTTTTVVDTTTLAAHDFDVDNRTGFMPPQPPPPRLPQQWEAWESLLDEAQRQRLQLGDKPDLTDEEKETSERWRAQVRNLPVLPIDDLLTSELIVRRAHHVLAWVMHFYIHSLPPTAPIIIPRPIANPLLQVSQHLNLPPLLTYSDDVLYNWELVRPSSDPTPQGDNLRCQSLFTGTGDEQEFYLVSARIELRGVEVLELMRETMDEAFIGDAIALRRITGYLHRMAEVIDELKTLLMQVRDGCRPDVFNNEIRPWLKGADSDQTKRQWVFEGLEELAEKGIKHPTELSGPSAGQSSLIHALDVFLGVDRYSHSSNITGQSSGTAAKKSFLERMQAYMPRHHRNFLDHLSANTRPLRDIVLNRRDEKLVDAYNAAVGALKSFRDSHIIIVTLYVIGPSRKMAKPGDGPLKGTGGTNLAQFLKDVRNSTQGALLQQ